MALDRYRQKRDFRRTPEPRGARSTHRGNSFVIHKHAARRLHYDLRLEHDGVLLSWAVPKGPSLDPGERRLAVRVEDHPLDYGSFEGNIPAGEYGAGAVIVWDRGHWLPQGDAAAGLRKGHLRFRLQGKKLAGEWSLVRMGKAAEAGKENWLLIKHRDEQADGHDVVGDEPQSVVSGKSVEEVAEGKAKRKAASATRKKNHVRARTFTEPGHSKVKASAEKLKPAPRSRGQNGSAKLAEFVAPQLATLVDHVPNGDGWLHEVKFDGYRALCRIDAGHAKFLTRHGLDWSRRFSSLTSAAAKLPCKQALLDGEVIVLDDAGVSDFGALQDALSRNDQSGLIYFAFDLLHLDGAALASLPLTERKQRLAALLQNNGITDGPLRYSHHVSAQGEQVFAKACELNLEGVISKRADGVYKSGRSGEWLKTKCLKRQEFVIAGFTDPAGSRAGFGALLLGVYDAQQQLVYSGKVGTGFSADALQQLRRRMSALEQDAQPFAKAPERSEQRGAHWLKPELVAEVAFTGWTRDGRLRHPAFQGLREDKVAGEIVREEPAPTRAVTARQSPAKEEQQNEIAGIRISHPDRVLYQEQGISKRDLALYYQEVADWILPHLKDRPLTLVRCPEGYKKECFYQRHANDTLDQAVARVAVREGGKLRDYVAIDSVTGLIALVQAGVLEFHTWGSRRDRLDRPDRITFDLDPDPQLAWSVVAQAARTLQARLTDLGLAAFVKTTGGKGLHVVVPIARNLGWDEIKAFAKGGGAGHGRRRAVEIYRGHVES